MFKSKKLKKEVRDWAIMLIAFGALYFSGWHVEVFGTIQGLFLKTGLVAPETISESQEDADFSMILEDREGNTLNMSDLKGKTIFINFWATWCPPCVAEMPEIEGLYNAVNSDDIVFLMISVDDDMEKLDKFVERKAFSFPVYQLTSNIPAQYKTGSIPSTFVVSPKGKLVLKHKGMASYNSSDFQSFIKKL